MILDQYASPEQLGQRLAYYRAERLAAGLSYDPLQVAVARQLHVANDKAEAEQALKRAAAATQRTVSVSRQPGGKAGSRPGSHVLSYAEKPGATEAHALYDTPDGISEKLEALQNAGVAHILLTTLGGPPQLRRFAREIMLAFTGEAGPTVGDGSKEARHHKMSVELTVATTTFMGDSYTFIDCPGSVEFIHDMRAALPAVDAAVVVCEADEKKMPQLQLIMRELEDLNIPRFLFLNKIDKAETKLMEALQILQPASRKPLVLRQIPIWNGGDIVTGFVDLALERAHVYKEHTASEVVPLEGESLEREKTPRLSMLEKLADHDDELMEQLLEDIPPPRDKVFDDLAKELRDGLVVPVLMGAAIRTNGV